jgi:hypothetical protein
MTFQQLRRRLILDGYTLVMEDLSLIDETQVYAIYRGETRITRLRTLDGVARWSKGL